MYRTSITLPVYIKQANSATRVSSQRKIYVKSQAQINVEFPAQMRHKQGIAGTN